MPVFSSESKTSTWILICVASVNLKIKMAVLCTLIKSTIAENCRAIIIIIIVLCGK